VRRLDDHDLNEAFLLPCRHVASCCEDDKRNRRNGHSSDWPLCAKSGHSTSDKLSVVVMRASSVRLETGYTVGVAAGQTRDRGVARLGDGYVFAMKCAANLYRFAMPTSADDPRNIQGSRAQK
jgi:hypothetical protein